MKVDQLHSMVQCDNVQTLFLLILAATGFPALVRWTTSLQW